MFEITAARFLPRGNDAELRARSAAVRELRAQPAIKLNGTTELALYGSNAAAATWERALPTIYDLVATDYLEIEVYQSSGGALNVTSNANYSPEFALQRLS